VNITRPCAQSPVAGSETWSRGYGAEDRRHRAEQGGVGRTFAYGVWNSVAGLTQVSGFPFQVFPSVVSGLDLSETIHGAGGVGGLLMWLQPQSVGWSSELELRPHWYTYDGNGNVSDLVSGDWDFTTFLDPAFSSALENHYEYGPFGGIVAATENRPENPFKFSTKWHEGNRLVYYGYRFYNPETGRWVSRDPINELCSKLVRRVRAKHAGDGQLIDDIDLEEEKNLFLFVFNNLANSIELHGLTSVGTRYQEKGLGGHAWIEIGGKGYGFGPDFTAISNIFWGPGTTSGYSGSKGNYTPRGVSIRYTGYFADDNSTSCACATPERINKCADFYESSWDGARFQFPTHTCRTYVSTIVGGCCLKLD